MNQIDGRYWEQSEQSADEVEAILGIHNSQQVDANAHV
jgi:hypothetical protein